MSWELWNLLSVECNSKNNTLVSWCTQAVHMHRKAESGQLKGSQTDPPLDEAVEVVHIICIALIQLIQGCCQACQMRRACVLQHLQQ